MKELKNIKNILFDCDGVLYADLEGVFGQVSKKMTQYISNKLNVDLKEAKELQTNYFHKYNTSLNGLMIHHDIPPREFLDYVHDINLDFLEKDRDLRKELETINLNKFVFTNGSKEHVKNITTQLGIDEQFDDVFDIVDAEYSPKPSAKAFDMMVEKLFGILTDVTNNMRETLRYSDEQLRHDRRAWIARGEEEGWWTNPYEYERDSDLETLAILLTQMLKYGRLIKNGEGTPTLNEVAKYWERFSQ